MRISKKQLIKSPLIVAGVALLGVATYLILAFTPATVPILAKRALNDLNREFTPINAVLTNHGFTTDPGKHRHCGHIASEKEGHYNCMQHRVLRRDITVQFLTDWNKLYPQLHNEFAEHGWQPVNSVDITTNQPIDGLGKLLSNKATYPAEFIYRKHTDDVRCEVRFAVIPAGSSTQPARFEVYEQCQHSFI